MLPVSAAESMILDLVQPLSDIEVVGLTTATGRILASTVTSQLDFPQADNSAMDGYAVRSPDVAAASPENPAIVEIIEEIPAGSPPTKALQSGQAARIFTGGVLPTGADAIVIQEDTHRVGDLVSIFAPATAGNFIRYRGSFYQSGMPLLESGIVLTAPEIAILAAVQCTEIQVYRRPRVAILSTGNELVPPDRPLQLGQIVDSNQYALAAFIEQMGGIPVPLGIVADDPNALKVAIERAIATADIVLSTGGVSVGDYDYVDRVLSELGGEIYIRSVAVKPGKPLTVATFSQQLSRPCLYFGIPGNPVSALVSCWRFVQPALRKLSGLKDNWRPNFVKARSRSHLQAGGKRETYLWGKIAIASGNLEFELSSGSHSSGNLINLAQIDALAVLPVGETYIAAGEWVDVMQVNWP